MAASNPWEYENPPTGNAGNASQIHWSRLDEGNGSGFMACTGRFKACLGMVRFVLVDLDSDRDRFGFVGAAMVVPMFAIRAVNMGCRGRVHSGISHRMRMSRARAKAVATCAVCPAFRLKRFFHGVHNQVHGPQHVGQHMVGLYFQVIGLELDRHMPMA